MNSHKCEIIANNFELVDQYHIFKDFKLIAKEDMNLLSEPILEWKAVNTALQANIKDLERSVELLSLLQAHDALCFLKNALAMPKLRTYSGRHHALAIHFCLHSTMFCAVAYPRSSTSTLMILNGHKHPCLSRWAD